MGPTFGEGSHSTRARPASGERANALGSEAGSQPQIGSGYPRRCTCSESAAVARLQVKAAVGPRPAKTALPKAQDAFAPKRTFIDQPAVRSGPTKADIVRCDEGNFKTSQSQRSPGTRLRPMGRLFPRVLPLQGKMRQHDQIGAEPFAQDAPLLVPGDCRAAPRNLSVGLKAHATAVHVRFHPGRVGRPAGDELAMTPPLSAGRIGLLRMTRSFPLDRPAAAWSPPRIWPDGQAPLPDV